MRRFLERILHLPRRALREAIIVFQLARFFVTNRIGRRRVTEPGGPVVSLTTYGARSRRVYFSIESIAAGEARPSRLILWIDDAELLANLPPTLLRLQQRGLEIKHCRNYGPHKKYYPYVESQERFENALVTADDDMLYPRFWLKGLADSAREAPQIIHCFCTCLIETDDVGLKSYQDWKRYGGDTKPRFRNLPLGVMGAVYPASFLSALKNSGTDFLACCPKADDIWLHVQALRAGYKIRQISRRLPYFSFYEVPGTQRTALQYENVTQGNGNDRQIRSTYNETDIQMLLSDRDADDEHLQPQCGR